MNSFENINIPWTGWKIVKELGEGGYGKVYEIERSQYGITERDALKIIRIPKDRRQYDAVAYSLTTEDEESIRAVFSDQKDKVINEIRAMQQLKATDNIVGIKDWTVSKLDDGYSWEICIRMDVLTPLVQHVKKNNGLEEAEVMKLGEDICRALEQCEKKNIVHRDIKPDNIMISPNGKFMLGDFGIARHLVDDTTMTKAGSKPYMAPEIANYRKSGKTVDLYSLGLVMYEMLNNCRPPFIKAKGKYSALEMENAIQRRIKGEELPEPANGSEDLKKIVLKACEPDPAKRYKNATAMLKDLKDMKVKGYGEKEEEKTSAEMSLEDLERDIFGETLAKEYKAEEAEMIDKYYDLYKRNEDFQKYIDKEYENLKRESDEAAPGYLRVTSSKENGRGAFRYSDGRVYEGEWKDNKPHGQGRMTYANGNECEGEWQNGKIHGHGKMIYAEGDIYEGEWLDGKICGYGKYIWPDGDEYEGEFLDENKHGHGKYTWLSGEIYEGEWKNDIRNGRGVDHYPDGRVYEGEWLDGKRNGHGKMTWPDGETYEGEWKDGNRHGHGKITYPDGRIYEGEWLDDMPSIR